MSALIPALASTVTVVDNSGKVLNTSKNLFSAFKEAREAYRTRKAEIVAERLAEKEARQRRREKRERRERREREKAEGKRHKKERKKSRSASGESEGNGTLAFDLDEEEDGVRMETLSRKSSRESLNDNDDNDIMHSSQDPMTLAKLVDISADLVDDHVTETLQCLLLQLQATIDELCCLTFGITTLITELQKCPDTLAVVGLTLAEISALVTKVAPGFVLTLKTAFPVIFGLLSSPQFAVVASVGMAATVVLLGGYKIIRNVITGPGGEEQNTQIQEVELGGIVEGEVMETNLIEAAPAAQAAPMTVASTPEPVMATASVQEPPKEKEKEKEKEKKKKVKALPAPEPSMESQPPAGPPSLTRKDSKSKREEFMQAFSLGDRFDKKSRKKSKDLGGSSPTADSAPLAFELESKEKEKKEKKEKDKDKDRKERKDKDRKERKKSIDDVSVMGEEKVRSRKKSDAGSIYGEEKSRKKSEVGSIYGEEKSRKKSDAGSIYGEEKSRKKSEVGSIYGDEKSRKKSDAGSIYGDEKARMKKNDEASVVGDEKPKLKKRGTILKQLFEGRSM
ncbi:hypothetical protein RUND412_000602 [Rhizina undulata]